ncbi:MAG: DUF1364 domain-containing protein [Dyella sp.]
MKTSKRLQRKTPLKAQAPLKARASRMRSSRPKMTAARRSAAGMPCLVRVPGVCNGRTDTTVLAHYRLSGYSGTGLKPSDAMGAWACSACHDAIDFRTKTEHTREALRLMHAEGCLRTQEAIRGGLAA